MALRFILLLSLLVGLALGDDRLKPGSSLQNGQTITSRNRTVELGFFSVPGGSPSDWYLGIWFSGTPEFVPLWIANRDRPVSSSASLVFTTGGELQITDNPSGVAPAWSTGTTTGLAAVAAILLDSGNLILTSTNTTDDAVVDDIRPNVTVTWQSFDHPADIWVPKMKIRLGMNLTSWSSKVSPATGRYIMRMLPSTEYVLTPINSMQQYWTSGVWDERISIFSNVPQMTGNYLYYFQFNSTPPPYFDWFEKTFYHSIFRLEHDGVIRVKWISPDVQPRRWGTVWPVPTSTCDVIGLCGNGTCTAGKSPPCNCPAQSQPVNQTNWSNENWSEGCTAPSSSRGGGGGGGSSSSSVGIGVGAAVGGGALVLLLAAFLVVRKRRRNTKHRVEKTSASVYFVDGELAAFTYKQLQAATDGFKHQLGSGGFGEVFKGNIHGEVVAVKRLMRFDDKQFRAEVSTIGTVKHINLVRLRGFCAEGQLQRLLVYEFVENGSLDRSLFSSDQAVLDWNTRFSIALGTAKGVAYLHEECRDRIIHCDIKPENILLDGGMKPKVADFGLAKLLGRDFSRVITSMRGTRGYLAPEWLSNLPITPKADVYSYGMTLFEIISGRRNIDIRNDRVFFPMLAARRVASGNFSGLQDERMAEWNQEQLERALKTAVWCVQDDEANRPSMKTVVQMLDGTLATIPDPAIPGSFEVWLGTDSEV